MQKGLIVLFCLLFIHNIDSAGNTCKKFANKVYQLKAAFPKLEPFYTLLTLLSGDMVVQVENIDNGNNVAQTGVDLKMGLHSGYCKSLAANKIRIITTGYIYAENSPNIVNGALSLHQYDLEFSDESNKECKGVYKIADYKIGTNPFSKSSTPFYTTATTNVTCEFFDDDNFEFPTNPKG